MPTRTVRARFVRRSIAARRSPRPSTTPASIRTAASMKPTAYRAGGAHATIRFAVGECSLGSILVAEGDRGVCAIFFGDDPERLVRDLEDRFPRARLVGGDAAFEQLVAKVVGFVEAPALGLDL